MGGVLKRFVKKPGMKDNLMPAISQDWWGNMLKILDDQLDKIAEILPEKWSSPVLLLSFLIILNIFDYLVIDMKTYAVIGAVVLVVWMLIGIRLREAYARKRNE